jgi:predicted amidohydrolase YtcJ
MKNGKLRVVIMLWRTLIFWGALNLAGTSAQAQQPSTDIVLYNGKIITVNDHSFSSQLGTIAEAMHVKDGKVLHIGTNTQIRPMAGPNTKVIDLKGRTVIPGLIETHEHPWDWTPVTPVIVKKVLRDDQIIVREMGGTPEENLKAFPGVLAEAVKEAKPGQWIYFIITLGKKYEYASGGNGGYGRSGMDPDVIDLMDGKRITKAQLDAAAPNNPVVLRDAFVSAVMNQKAIAETRKVFPQPGVNPFAESDSGVSGDMSGPGGFPFRLPMRWIFQDVMMKDRYPQLMEIMRLGLEWWAGYGLTTFGSNAYAPSNLRVFRDLDQKGEMPIRNMWTWNWRPDYLYEDPFMMADLATRAGIGTDHLWMGGAIISIGSACTTAEPLPSSRLAKYPPLNLEARRRTCAYSPGSLNAKLLYDYIKAGGRFVNMHTSGDEDIDNMLNIIVQASKDAGMTEEQIRAKRHGFDHSVMWPRPDQVPVLKRLGIVVSGDSFEIIQASPAIFNIYGEKVASWVVPKKRLVEGGIYNTFEIDRGLSITDMTLFSAGITPMINRKGWDGKVYGSDQAVDRQTALKIATIWGAYYVLREDVLGSLEPGKWADFAVLDRDYLTIPEEDIANIRVLMTVVGGKVIHLVPSLAREIGMNPAGAQVTLDGPASKW